MLRAILTIPVRVHEDVGISSDAKEAIAFAYLAKSALEGQMSNIPAATGARPGVLGEICYPLPHVKGGRDMSQSISVEAKIGQLMVFGFNGTRVTSFLRRMITEHNLGGVIHFARNVESVKQLTGLNQELQALSSQSPSGVPLWIAADQEGGTVARLTRGVAVAPSAMALGAAGSEVLTERVCEVAGRELGGAGINMNLAPVVDVNNNPENPVIGVRSFGETPQDVARHGAAAIRGYQKYVAAVAKHFPGARRHSH
jgi:beta-N-acetylhexosaminidase